MLQKYVYQNYGTIAQWQTKSWH